MQSSVHTQVGGSVYVQSHVQADLQPVTWVSLEPNVHCQRGAGLAGVEAGELCGAGGIC